jgi:hypothetical protein
MNQDPPDVSILMKSPIHRFFAMAAMSVPLVGALVLNGCDSPVAPKFPEPVEDEDTITTDGEGATGRRTIGRMIEPTDSLRRLIFVPCAETPTCR